MKFKQVLISDCEECPHHERHGFMPDICNAIKSESGEGKMLDIETYPKFPGWCPLATIKTDA